MSETAQIILAACIGCAFLTAAFTLIVLAIDTIRGWKNEQSNRSDD